LQALRRRHDDFHTLGCRLSDHGLNHCYSDFCTEREAALIFDKALKGEVTAEEQSRFASFMMLFFGHLDAEKGWTKQLHLGAHRSVSTRMKGPDVGLDSIGDWPQGELLGAYLNELDRENVLPKMILYNVNPADNYLFATMCG